MARVSRRNMGTQLGFNGSDDKITTNYVPSTSAFSFTFWFKPTKFVANQRILDWQASGPADGFTVLTASGTGIDKLAFRCSNGGSGVCDLNSAGLTIGKWYFVAGTYQPDSMLLYINGALVASDTSGTMTAPAATTLTIGCRGAGSFANMVFDDLMMFERVLSAAEISALYTDGTKPLPGPALWYKLDEGTMENCSVNSHVIVDSSGNGNTGTHATATTNDKYLNDHPLAERFAWPTASAGLSFGANSTDRVNCGTNSSLTDFGVTNALTFEAWVYVRSHPNVLPRVASAGPHYVCFMGDSTNAKYRKFALEVQNVGATSIHEYWGATALQYNRWYHVAATFNAVTKFGRIYINGLEDNTDEIRATGTDWTGSLASTVSPFMIGNTSSGSNDRVTDSIIKYVKIYNRDLTPTEIYARAHSDVRITDGLVGEWLMTEGSGSSLADTSGTGNTGTITGAAWSTPAIRGSAIRSASNTRSAA